MTLEQRLEVVEAELAAMKIRGGYEFVVDDGTFFINGASIQSGSINAARVEAAEVKNAKISGEMSSSGKS